MPCRDYGEDMSSPSLEDEIRISQQSERLDKLTALLCGACHKLEDNNLELSGDLKTWFTEHNEADKDHLKNQLEFATSFVDHLSREDFELLDSVLTKISSKFE